MDAGARLYDPRLAATLLVLVKEDLYKNKAAWRELYTNFSIKELAEVVMEEEIEVRLTEKKTLYVKDTEWAAHIMKRILISTDQVLLESLLFGNLAKDRRTNPQLAAVLRTLKEQSEHQPGIYYLSLVNSRGESPSAK